MGTFPVRFPSTEESGDAGWHVDAGFPGDDPADFFSWRINVRSKGRALLMLFLFSDISEQDAPTRLRISSHLDVAGLLKNAGEEGLSFMELATKLTELPERDVTLATGKAGTVYLCHPFLVHAAQAHRGTEPRFLAQPPPRAQE
ncbi:phytanoyl-CoA dioxygenase family protein [Spirosoma fluminis]